MRPVGAKNRRVRLGSSGQNSPPWIDVVAALSTRRMAERGMLDSPTADAKRTMVGVTSSTRPMSTEPSRSVSLTSWLSGEGRRLLVDAVSWACTAVAAHTRTLASRTVARRMWVGLDCHYGYFVQRTLYRHRPTCSRLPSADEQLRDDHDDDHDLEQLRPRRLRLPVQHRIRLAEDLELALDALAPRGGAEEVERGAVYPREIHVVSDLEAVLGALDSLRHVGDARLEVGQHGLEAARGKREGAPACRGDPVVHRRQLGVEECVIDTKLEELGIGELQDVL